MEERKTIAETLRLKKHARPNKLKYGVLKIVARYILGPQYHPRIIWKTDFRKEKGPFVLISNHASRADYLFNAAFIKERFNFVLGYNEFFRSHLAGTVGGINCIPKKNFTPDIPAMVRIVDTIKKGGCISIYPEGMSSISGANQPIANGTGNFLKKLGVPVYYSVIKGGYLSCPKYNVNDRFGHVESVLDIMFTKEQLEALSAEEIEDKINELIYHDDYEWNLKKKYHYEAKGKIAEGLHTLLYHCPKCHKDYTMTSSGNKIWCNECGNGAELDDTYEMHPFNKDCVIPRTQTEWFRMERELAKEEVKDPNFQMKVHVKLGMLPDYELLKDKKTSEIVGKGELTIDRNGLTYKGTRKGEIVEINLPLNKLPTYGMCTDVTRFYTFFNGVFHEFYPDVNIVEKWFLVTEELHRLMGGPWRDFKFDVTKMPND